MPYERDMCGTPLSSLIEEVPVISNGVIKVGDVRNNRSGRYCWEGKTKHELPFIL